MRRRRGEDAVWFDHRGPCTDPERHRHCPGRWCAEVTLGWTAEGKRNRRRVVGATKTAVTDKLKSLRKDLDKGIVPAPGSGSYTLQDAIDAWLAEGLVGRSPKTVTRNRSLFYLAGTDDLRPEFTAIGKRKLRELTATQVRHALDAAARTRSTATVSLIHNCLTRAIRHAEAHDRVSRNVAALVDTPQGQPGRPSKSLSPEQAAAVLKAAESSELKAYITLSLTTGIRTEEARALLWTHVVTWDVDEAAWRPVTEAGWEHDKFAIYVWRSVRAGGRTKTERSRRTLGLPEIAVTALREEWQHQAADRRPAWEDHGLVFCTSVGTPLDVSNVLKRFKAVCKAAGIGTDWTPREMRHTFVSLMSESGMPVEEIAALAGHTSSRTTETVYRHELRPVLRSGAEAMDARFRPES